MNRLQSIDCKNYTIVKKMDGLVVPILPWGSCEPHGEHLPYTTDTMLAEEITYQAIAKTGLDGTFVVIPPVSYGSQNPGQTDKTLCLHMSVETQSRILDDIVLSLVRQNIRTLVIVNGHNGNNFKCIVRDIEWKHPGFKIYVCNYLDIADKETVKKLTGLEMKYPDDHAGFTETSLMLHFRPYLVDMDMTTNRPEEDNYIRQDTVTHRLWTPRDWDQYSHETRIGFAGEATSEYGREIADHIACKMAVDLVNLVRNEEN